MKDRSFCCNFLLCLFLPFLDGEQHRYVDFHIIDAVRHGHSYSTTQKVLYSQDVGTLDYIKLYIKPTKGSPYLP